MYIDIITGLIIGLLILAARESITYKRNKEAAIAIANYKARIRDIDDLKKGLAEANKIIAELRGEINGNM